MSNKYIKRGINMIKVEEWRKYGYKVWQKTLLSKRILLDFLQGNKNYKIYVLG